MPAKKFAAIRFSTLDEINGANVSNLLVAFAFSTGVDHVQEAAPIMANNTMFIVTPYPNIVFALDLTKPVRRSNVVSAVSSRGIEVASR